jgi:Methyltransferase domain
LYTIDACPCCESKQLTLLPAIVSPFLAKYVLRTTPPMCSLSECEGCSFRFFNSRLTPDEVGKLYSEYRGNEYFRQRHAVEPWYSQRVNDAMGGDPDEIQTRNRAVEGFLSPHVNIGSIGSVLDYGGDKGQFIPALLGKQKFVFELSDARPVDHVTRIGSDAELQKQRFDFIISCGVLEHCSEPLEILQALGRLANGPDCYLFIAVPYERFGLGLIGSGKLYRAYLELLRKSGPLLTLVDLYSSAARIRLNTMPPLGVVKCHEHLNFFNERSMNALLRRANMEMLACTIATMNSYPVPTPSLMILARPIRN